MFFFHLGAGGFVPVLGFTMFYWVMLGFTGFYWVLYGYTTFYWVLLGFTGFYYVLLGFTGFYWVLLWSLRLTSRPAVTCMTVNDGGGVTTL